MLICKEVRKELQETVRREVLEEGSCLFLIGQVPKNWTKAQQKQIWQNYDKGI